MAKPHINIKKVSASNASPLCGAYGHNLRTNEHEDWSHIDATRTYLNHDLVNPAGVFYRDLVDARIREASIEAGRNLMDADAVIAYTVYLAYTHGAEKENGFSVAQWEEASLKWLQNYFGERNVVSAMVHMDESSPHIHAVVVPITPDGRLCAKDYTGSREKMQAIWKSYAAEMSKPPFYMDRVQSRGRKASHEGIRKFYAQINDIEEFQFPQQEEQESNDAYIERLRGYVQRIERRRLSERLHLEEEADHAKAEVMQLRQDFKEAINLQQYLSRRLLNDALVKEELMKLYLFEQYPRRAIAQMFELMKEQYGEIDLSSEHFFDIAPKAEKDQLKQNVTTQA